MITHFKNLLLLCILGLAAIACSSSKEAEIITNEIDDFKTYPIDITIDNTSIFDLIENIEFLGLEETEQSLLGYVFGTIFTENRIVFKNGNVVDEIFIYSEQGEFLNKISRKGGGPEEYSSILSFWLNKDLIEVFDGKRIVSYDLNGSFVKAALVKQGGIQINGLEDGYVTDVSRSPVDGELKFKLAFLNNQFERDTLAIPYETAKKTRITWLTTPFSNYNDNLLYQHPNGDTTYKLQSKTATPLFSIDLGEKWLWKDKEIYDNLEKQSQLMRENKAISMFFTKVSEKKIYLDLIRNGKFLVNRQTGNYQKISFDKNGEGRYFMTAVGWDDERMVFSMSSSDLAEFIGGLGKDKVSAKFGANLETIESSENPVLIWVKFKDID